MTAERSETGANVTATVNGVEMACLLPGPTTDGYWRWVIPTNIVQGDTIQMHPWPPEIPVILMCMRNGRYQAMLRFDPGDTAIPAAFEHWNWALPAVIAKDGSRRLMVGQGAHCICPSGLIGSSVACPVHNPYPAEQEPEVTTLESPREPTTTADLRDRLQAVLTPAGQAAADAESLVAGRDALIESLRGVDDPIVLWWLQKAYEESQATVTKARQYGSMELRYAGHVIAAIGNRQVTDAEALELQIFHYVLGKLGRWTAAVRRSEQVSDDTIFDILQYCRMVQYIRETGNWVE